MGWRISISHSHFLLIRVEVNFCFQNKIGRYFETSVLYFLLTINFIQVWLFPFMKDVKLMFFAIRLSC